MNLDSTTNEVNLIIFFELPKLTVFLYEAFIMFKLATKDTKMHYQAKELADYEKIITMDYNRKPVVYNVRIDFNLRF